jgi:hypothetical protein
VAEVEALKQRLRKTDAEITETKRQIGRDESWDAGAATMAGVLGSSATEGTLLFIHHIRFDPILWTISIRDPAAFLVGKITEPKLESGHSVNLLAVRWLSSYANQIWRHCRPRYCGFFLNRVWA